MWGLSLQSILVGIAALIIGLIAGNLRGEIVGAQHGYTKCQAQNASATRKANARARKAERRLAIKERREDTAAQKAITIINATPADDEQCRALTDEEREAWKDL